MLNYITRKREIYRCAINRKRVLIYIILILRYGCVGGKKKKEVFFGHFTFRPLFSFSNVSNFKYLPTSSLYLSIWCFLACIFFLIYICFVILCMFNGLHLLFEDFLGFNKKYYFWVGYVMDHVIIVLHCSCSWL